MKSSLSVAVAILVMIAAAPADAQVRPNASWRQIETEHFTVIYEEGLDSVARHAAERAEIEHARLSRELIRAPKGRIDLVIADNTDVTNGNARPFPNDRIVIWIRPPVDEVTLQSYDDWIDLLVAHELTHIFHHDPAGKVGRALRAVFGRLPLPWPVFPLLGVPRWDTEGLATLVESRHTDGGRLQGSFNEMVVRTDILENAFPTIDRISGETPLWPGGHRAYIYGSLLMDYVERRFGPQAHTEIIKRSAGSLLPPPWRLDAIAKKAVGRSFTDIHKDWKADLETTYGALADSLRAQGLTQSERITTTGRWASHPRVSPDGRKLAYAEESGRDVSSTRVVDLETGADERIRRNGLGRAVWLPDSKTILVDQYEFSDRNSIQSDLYIERETGSERLTNGARAESPDITADGQRIVYVQNDRGSNRLIVRDVANGAERIIAERSPDVHWTLPRWSPDGRRIAVQRWTRGRGHDVVILLQDGGDVATIRTDGTDAAPTWSADGRYVLFASDRTGLNNIHAFDVNGTTLWQVTNVLTGAFFPEVSPDGKSIYYAEYHTDGFHIQRIPYDTAAWRPLMRGARPDRMRMPRVDSDTMMIPAVNVSAPRAYSPIGPLLPKYWAPVIMLDSVTGDFIGASTWGEDAVQRHSYTAMLAYDVTHGRVAGDLSYSYAGLGNPVLTAHASRIWDNTGLVTVRDIEGAVFDTASSYEREDRLALSASLVHRKWRGSSALTVGVEGVEVNRKLDYGALRTDPRDRLLGVLAGASFANYRYPQLAISPEDGIRTSVQARRRFEIDPLPDRDQSYNEINAFGAAYKSLGGKSFAHSVFAVRASALHRTNIGPGPTDIGGVDGFLPVRGYPDDERVGFSAWTASAEYRMPLRMIARGYRLRPLFIDRVAAAFFVDAGNASCTDEQRRVYLSCVGNTGRPSEMLLGGGFELSAPISVLSFVPIWTRLGIGFPIGGESRTAQVYLTLAPSF